ncbi:condensation domain-containing protein [Kitasatospora sp. NPDC005751]|uniref:condensation domain-containing protein n=1 Tax=Kitasatospora sp. NPDC005751 TaxID=3157064 RepID=UPI0033EE564A
MTAVDQADLLRRARGRRSAAAPPRRPTVPDGPAPLSHAQQRMWLMDHLGQGGALYNVPIAARLRGPLDRAALAAALTGLTERHAVLRTRYPSRAGQPYQQTDPVAPVPLPVVDATTDEAAAVRLAAEAARPFDLATGPVLRALLLRNGPQDHTLVLTIHHIAVDGGSLPVLAADLAALYEAARDGTPPRLPAPGPSYAEYARQERARDAELTAAADALAARLTGARPPALLRAVPPGARERRAALHAAPLDPAVLDRLRGLGARHGATLFTVVLAAAFATLRTASGQDDLVLGCASGHRARPDLRHTVGLAVNTLAVRVDPAGDPSFAELLTAVRGQLLDAQRHHDVPFDLVVERLGAASRGTDGTPLLSVTCDLIQPAAPLTLPGLTSENVELDLRLAKFGLALLVEEGPAPRCLVQHDRDVLDEATAVHLLDAFAAVLTAVAGEADPHLSELPGRRLAAAEHPVVEGLLADPGVVEAAVIERADGPPLAYAVVRGPVAPTGTELRAALRGRLPAAELPHAVTLVDRLPRHPDGAPDPARLPGAATPPGDGLPPDGPVDTVREAFGELLGTTPPADGDFFALGGHSLVAVQLAERLRIRTGLPLTGLDILEQRTPRALAAVLAGREDERRAALARTSGARPRTRSRTGTVLLTGATGGVGAAVLQELMAQGRPVRVLVRPESAHLPALNGAEVAEGDLADPDSLRRAVEGADAVIHSACTFTDHATDLAAMRALVDGWRGGGPFVFVSSIDAYGRPAGTQVPEGSPSGAAVTPYGQAKLDCERILFEAAATRSGQATAVRAPIVWGPHHRLRDQLRWGSTGALYQAALAGRPIALPVADHWYGASWVHAAALARALAACTTPGHPAAGRVVNAVSGHVSWAEFTAELVRLLGTDSPITTAPDTDEELRRPWHYLTETLTAPLTPEPGEDWRTVLATMVG